MPPRKRKYVPKVEDPEASSSDGEVCALRRQSALGGGGGDGGREPPLLLCAIALLARFCSIS